MAEDGGQTTEDGDLRFSISDFRFEIEIAASAFGLLAMTAGDENRVSRIKHQD